MQRAGLPPWWTEPLSDEQRVPRLRGRHQAMHRQARLLTGYPVNEPGPWDTERLAGRKARSDPPVH